MPPEVRRPHPYSTMRSRPVAPQAARPSRPPRPPRPVHGPRPQRGQPAYRVRPSVVQRLDPRTLVIGLVATVLVAVGLPALGGAASRDTPDAARPAAVAAPTLDDQLRSYLAGRKTTASVQVLDLATGHAYAYRASAHYDSASVIKIAIMTAVLRRADAEERLPTSKEKQLLGRMIKNSDNGAASSLWSSLGRGTALQEFFTAAGMTHTTPGPRGYWGLTRVTAADQVTLMGHLVQPTSLLTDGSRRYARSLLAKVEKDQDWGVSAGADAAGATVELKNGWLPRGRDGWAVHSVGHVEGEGRNYLIAVLSVDNATEKKGIATVEGVSTIVWQGLAPR